MAKEIEVKFLVDPKINPSKLGATNVVFCMQGYTKDGIRIAFYRHNDGKHLYKINYKTGKGLARDEYQCDIPEEVFKGLWPLTEGRRIQKNRFIIPFGMYEIELDVYAHAKKLPLMTAEIEFPSVKEAKRVCKAGLPPYFIKDLTNNKRMTNRKLSC